MTRAGHEEQPIRRRYDVMRWAWHLRVIGPLVVAPTAVGVGPRSAVEVPVAGTQAHAKARPIFNPPGQDPLQLYTGTYASTSTVTLNAPANASAGVYNGYLVVTLVQ